VKGSASVSQGGIYGLTPGPIIYPYVGNGPGSRFAPGYWYVLDPSSNDSLVSSPEARLGPPAFFAGLLDEKSDLTCPVPYPGGSGVAQPNHELSLREAKRHRGRMVGPAEFVQKRGSGRSERKLPSVASHFLQPDFLPGITSVLPVIRSQSVDCWRFDAISVAHVRLTAVDRKLEAFSMPWQPSATCPSGTSRPATAAETSREE
jgi:hypothetical protein